MQRWLLQSGTYSLAALRPDIEQLHPHFYNTYYSNHYTSPVTSHIVLGVGEIGYAIIDPLPAWRDWSLINKLSITELLNALPVVRIGGAEHPRCQYWECSRPPPPPPPPPPHFRRHIQLQLKIVIRQMMHAS